MITRARTWLVLMLIALVSEMAIGEYEAVEVTHED